MIWLIRSLACLRSRSPAAWSQTVLVAVSCALFLWLRTTSLAQVCGIKADEQVLFFPAMAFQSENGWMAQVRGCVFEPEKRDKTLAILDQALKLKGIPVSERERAILRERARLFLVDHKAGRQVVVKVAGRHFVLGKSLKDGTFSGEICLPEATVRTLGTNTLSFEAVLPTEDPRYFSGTLTLVANTGVSIISDIDDTLKITSVRDRNAMLRNSFLKPFRAVPGMAELLSSWDANINAQFFYVSASPWQFFRPLDQFLATNGFPPGVYSLKQVHWRDRNLLNLFADPESYKRAAIVPLLQRFPERRFVLVGDSGERDPEVYASLARRYPRQIVRVLIRDVTEESASSRRYQDLFHGLPRELWQVFSKPEEIASLGPGLKRVENANPVGAPVPGIEAGESK